MQIKFKRLNGRACAPRYAHHDDACFDMTVVTDDPGETVVIKPRQTVVFGTGVAFEIPEGHVMKMYVRSSVGIKKNLVLSNGTGIIDAGYRGEVRIALTNIGNRPEIVTDGNRIAQCEICPVNQVSFLETDELSESGRGTGGIGSSGK